MSRLPKFFAITGMAPVSVVSEVSDLLTISFRGPTHFVVFFAVAKRVRVMGIMEEPLTSLTRLIGNPPYTPLRS